MATANFAYAASADDAAAQPVLAIFADRPHIRHQLREDALAAGFRVNESGPVASLHAGDARPLAEVVLVDCPAPDGAALAALAAVAYGADGLCIEAHVEPTKGIGDDPKQALTPDVLRKTIAQARQLWAIRKG